MSAQPSSTNPHRRFNSRTSSRAILSTEVDMINRYARKYSTQYKTAPYSAVSPAFSAKTANDDSVSVASSVVSMAASQGGAPKGRANMHAKRPSNLVQASNRNLWNDNALNNQHQDMESAMENMITSYQTRLAKQANFLEEIEREASQNKDFGKLENADDWSNLEVCHWLATIHLEKYIQNFADQIIDGSILIRDLDESILIAELGIKKIHVKKIMREIHKLQQLCPKISNQSGSKDTLVESLKLEITSLQRENKHLREQMKSMQGQTHFNDMTHSATTSHFSSNTGSMTSLHSSNNSNVNKNLNNGNGAKATQKHSSAMAGGMSAMGGYAGMQSSHAHNYTVNPRNYKKY